MKVLSTLMTDFYKFCHQGQYDPRIIRLVSYGTPRGCRLPGKKYVINFGVQAFCKEYLIEHFNQNFFNRDWFEVETELIEFLNNTLPGLNVKSTVDNLYDLHKLGYLPISLRTIPEGGKVALGCPNIEIVTTEPGFQWIGGFIESLISSFIWKPMIDATVGHWYRETANKYFEKTADDWQIKARSAMSEFGFRGADSPESGIHSGAAWLLSFDKTATCAAIPWVNKMYDMDYSNVVGKGLISTEHSVMCSGTALKIKEMKSKAIDITKYYEVYKNVTNSDDKMTFLNSLRNMYLDPQVEHTEWVIPHNIWMNRWFKINGEIFKYSVTNDKFWKADEDKLQEVAETKVVMRLLTEVYPYSSFSMVSDSYDYWRMVTKILPILKNEVLNHNGTLFVRGDSGDPVKIVAGYVNASPILAINGVKTYTHEMNDQILVRIPELNEDFRPKLIELKELAEKGYVIYYHNSKLYQISWINICSDDAEFYAYETTIPECELKGTVECLWDTFGGSFNSKNYMVLDNHVRATYGDSITQQRQELIYRILELKGFSVENVALGAGSFSFHCYQDENGKLYPYTRDTYNWAQKATYGEYESHHVGSAADGSGGLQHYTELNPLMIYKDPKTDNDHFKKSMKGCCAVYTTEMTRDGNCTYYLDHDELTLQEREEDSTNNKLVEIFRDGKMVHEWTFSEIRDELNLGKF